MLHVERADHVNAGVQQLGNVLVAFLLRQKGHWYDQLIDDGHLGFLKSCVESISSIATPLYSTRCRGITSSPSISAAVSSRHRFDKLHNIDPAFFRAWASSSIW
jgi:hypothetical protein